MSVNTFIVFSNQLFDPPVFTRADKVVLVNLPTPKGIKLHPVRAAWTLQTCEAYIKRMRQKGYHIHHATQIPHKGRCSYVDPCDLLTSRMCKRMGHMDISHSTPSPMFIMSIPDLNTVMGPNVKSNHVFFKKMKQHMGLEFLGASTDKENQNPLKDPKDWPTVAQDSSIARDIPITHEQARSHLQQFLKHRFILFGHAQDAMVKERSVLFHSHISYLLNVGLLTPREVLDAVLKFAKQNKKRIPMNSLEAFVRQLLGWREYMRYLYVIHGSKWQKLLRKDTVVRPSKDWYKGATGIEPVDQEIAKVQETAWAHHIVRLMIFLNVLRLQGYGPRAVYTWFMEMVSLDAYDWVMLTNILTMGFYVRGFTHKPYISSSKYLLRMSNYKRGPWANTIDTLYHARMKTIYKE